AERVPGDLSGGRRRPAYQRDHLVPARPQGRGQGAADEPRGPRHRDFHSCPRLLTRGPSGPLVRVFVGCEPRGRPGRSALAGGYLTGTAGPVPTGPVPPRKPLPPGGPSPCPGNVPRPPRPLA